MAMNQQGGTAPDVAEVTGVPTEVDALSAVAGLLHALSDPNRLAILEHLALGEHRVVDLTAHLGLAQSTVSKHLACLRDCGLVVSRPSGRASMISLAQPELTHAVLAATVRLLDVTSGPCGAA
ncbi:metalloregulator ArsR/SmtB family transcription factor [Pimelobacter simplex]|uniref:Transcriptional regulator, ArsR family n=1 Tax=Nocardioides simplex TaxID=2045 RepID=A0A0A1DUE8_NOCSI|nr:metalloregulator ArsR/SmtB family transcription factor [Pimelobacter simplex]AIY20218.2 Transcriptional regulator, ArsR family [Pimelobacter simplex]MCG8149681.1 metalloregulator ArsR/SmtB family transcription factor [Pimelobacter simplex]GEB15956.1 hypothetical protein NSI01_42710 [Pimelobacter simplex]SFM82914.1 DNA-binding transcriptional regulator, ArsR family [Pimelobacter simplex]